MPALGEVEGGGSGACSYVWGVPAIVQANAIPDAEQEVKKLRLQNEILELEKEKADKQRDLANLRLEQAELTRRAADLERRSEGIEVAPPSIAAATGSSDVLTEPNVDGGNIDTQADAVAAALASMEAAGQAALGADDEGQ